MEANGKPVEVLEGANAPQRPKLNLPVYGHRPLLGAFNLKLDKSGRVSLPNAFRHAFYPGPDEAILAILGDFHIAVFTPYSFESFVTTGIGDETRTMVSPRSNRWIAMNSYGVAVDSQFRLVVPPEIRERVDLGSLISVVGSWDRLEIWNREAFGTEDEGRKEAAEWMSNREIMK